MPLNFSDKITTLLGVFQARGEIKQTLLRRHWAKKKTFRVNLPGYDVTLSTDDYYSTALFYQYSHVYDDVYEPLVTHFLVERLKTSRCFVDVGANLGYFTTIAAKVRPDISVYAFELDSTMDALIQRNLRLNSISNVTVIYGAVGDSEDVVSYTPHAYTFLGMISGIPTEPFEVKLSTKTFRLDDYFEDKPVKPDFMKVDIDGAEMAMLRGSETLLAQPELEMLLEVHPHHLPKFNSSAAEVINFLRDRGFRCLLLGDFRRSNQTQFEDITDRPEVLKSKTGDMVYVTRNPSMGGA
jgi:FkbM family methyltransferase